MREVISRAFAAVLMTRARQMLLNTLAIAGVLACEGKGVPVGGVPVEGRAIRVAIDSASATRAIVVSGFSSSELTSLHRLESEGRWQAVVRLSVSSRPDVAIAGRYTMAGTAIRFEPTYPFDAGRTYAVHIDIGDISSTRRDSLTVMVTPQAAGDRRAVAVVQRVLPTTDSVPENLLRLYIEFSAPMSRVSGLPYVKLIDSNGRDVSHAFLPLDADFWNDELTRYTLFLDPGRVKRGILPNEQLGRAIRAGKRYTLVVDSTWPDAQGRLMRATYRKSLVVGAPDVSTIALKTWRVAAPAAGSRAPLVVTFAKPIDYGLLQRALGVERAGADAVAGTVAIAPGEREWRFTPSTPWRAGAHAVVVLSMLEDAAGNRIDHPFEVDMFDRVDMTAAPERYRVPFVVR